MLHDTWCPVLVIYDQAGIAQSVEQCIRSLVLQRSVIDQYTVNS